MAAVVPSRARGHNAHVMRPPQPPSSTPVTYIKMILRINSLRGNHLSPPPVKYSLRWMRAGKQLKSTSAYPIDVNTHAFSGTVSLYTGVKRSGFSYISDKPDEPLLTELVLFAHDATEAQPAPVANAEFDVAKFLQQMIRASTKSMTTEISFTAAIKAGATLIMKALGENHLTPIEDHPDLREEDSTGQELEKLKADVREKELKLDQLTASTDKLEEMVLETAKVAETAVPAAELAALRVKVDALEHDKTILERERAEAERKVGAHVAHAAKIKTTYNQLAGWYNNLCAKHTELQKRLSESDTSTDGTSDLPTDVATTHEEDIKNLEQERDQLKAMLDRERSEKKDISSRNSELLQAKARTLAELGEQWEAAKLTLENTKMSLKNQLSTSDNLRETVKTLEDKLAKRDEEASAQSGELEKASRRVKELEEKFEEARTRADADAESKAAAEADYQRLQTENADQREVLTRELSSGFETMVEEKLSALRKEHDESMQMSRQELKEILEKEHSFVLEKLQNEHENNIAKIKEDLEKEAEALRTAASGFEEKLNITMQERSNLQEEVVNLKGSLEEKGSQLQMASKRTLETYEIQIQQLKQEKELAEKHLISEKDRNAALQSDAEASREALEKDLTDARQLLEESKSELTRIQEETSASESESRSIPLTLENRQQLEEEISNLKKLLKNERERGDQVASHLAVADSEHDEMRAMITRLRSERDGAVQELQKSKDAVPNTQVRLDQGRKGATANGEGTEPHSLLEERDKAIRELFRVRKSMNKTIKKLKEENQVLVSQLEINSSEDRISENQQQKQEYDEAVSELAKIRAAIPLNPKSRSLPTDSGTPGFNISSHVLGALESLRSEVEEYKTSNLQLQKAAKDLSNEKAEESRQLISKQDELVEQLAVLSKELDNSRSVLSERERSIENLTHNMKSTAMEQEHISKRYQDTLREKESADRRVAVLESELEEYKRSLEKTANSNSSAENELRKTTTDLIDSRKELSLLQSKHSEYCDAAKKSQMDMESKIGQLKNEQEKREASSKMLIEKLEVADANLTEEKRKFDSEMTGVQKQVKDFEKLIQDLKASNAQLKEKLTGEQDKRQAADASIEVASKNCNELEKLLSQSRLNETEKEKLVAELASECDEAKSNLSEQRRELLNTKEALKEQKAQLDAILEEMGQLKSSRDDLEREAAKANGLTAAGDEALNALRGETKQLQQELTEANKQLQIEREKVVTLKDKEKERSSALQDLRNTLEERNEVLQSTNEITTAELRTLQDSYRLLDKSLASKTRKSEELESALSEQIQICNELKAQVAKISAMESHEKGKCEQVAKDFRKMETELEEARNYSKTLEENRARADILEAELEEMRHHAQAMEDEKQRRERESSLNKKSSNRRVENLRMELESTKSMIEALQSEVHRLQANNSELEKEVGSLRSNADARDTEVLNDLINTRMELAYSQEETIRLRNKLKKLGHRGQGSSSFH